MSTAAASVPSARLRRAPRRLAVPFAAAALLAALAGCATPGGETAAFTGTWGSSASGQPNLTIEDDGKVSGTDGCNRLTGTGTVSGDTFRFGNLASTMMACEGVDEWLGKASTASVDGKTLIVYDDSNKKIGTLEKQ
ncbi:META domain-containing protein [Leifsonia sp. F6_8S_P_1B]|uniref:META domain-containing protein n=1 Tax=Leifsonia williamsii TaxID=3035919 RepID=A0ABT8K834_9MICO|nr:META domain-containing protein [Leifsonia williamsii]MDN4613599.1 META domain-containing protein [Leifsonia williamsii]